MVHITIWWATYFLGWVLHIFCPDILVWFWCFINMTILFAVIAIFGKVQLLFGNQPYHQHYSEHDIPIFGVIMQFAPPPPPPNLWE